MRAVVHDRYGPPEVQRLEEVEQPVPAEGEVLVKVHATTVNRTDCGFRQATPFFSRAFTGLRSPGIRSSGWSWPARSRPSAPPSPSSRSEITSSVSRAPVHMRSTSAFVRAVGWRTCQRASLSKMPRRSATGRASRWRRSKQPISARGGASSSTAHQGRSVRRPFSSPGTQVPTWRRCARPRTSSSSAPSAPTR